MDLMFFVNSFLFGVGLAMDAFSVSLANGLNNPSMKYGKMFGIAGVFAFFQAFMPMLGWFCVHSVVEGFESLTRFVPFIAFVLLLYIGGKMLYEGIRGGSEESVGEKMTFYGLIIQGVATSIDALSVGFTIADYNWLFALVSALIIALVTLFICLFGVWLGKKFGTKLSGKAALLGGGILIFIGFEILIKSLI